MDENIESDEATALAIPNIELRRGHLKYSSWIDKLFKLCLKFVHPEVMDWQTLKHMSREVRNERME